MSSDRHTCHQIPILLVLCIQLIFSINIKSKCSQKLPDQKLLFLQVFLKRIYASRLSHANYLNLKKRKQLSTPLFDDHDQPDTQDTWESMIPKVKSCGLLCKHKHFAPSLTASNLSFGEEYNKAFHGETLRKELNLSNLSTS